MRSWRRSFVKSNRQCLPTERFRMLFSNGTDGKWFKKGRNSGAINLRALEHKSQPALSLCGPMETVEQNSQWQLSRS